MVVLSLLETISVALSAICANKMRSFLTMLGIIIGISSVMIITTLGLGAERDLLEAFSRYGLNRADITMNWNSKDPILNRDFITFEDLDVVGGMVSHVDAVSPRLLVYVSLKGKNGPVSIMLNGVDAEFLRIENINIIRGRFITKQDEKSRRNVTVIDEKTARDIFGTTDCLGQVLTVSTGNRSLELMVIGIIGVPDSTMAEMFGAYDITAYSPVSVVRRLSYIPNLDRFSVTVKNSFEVETVGRMILNYLERRHRSEGKYRFYDYNSNANEVKSIFGIVTTIVSSIAAISLLVGGIGIMNIMLVSVTERTTEIGIRKALGARPGSVLVQFLVEAVILSLTGGILGILTGCAIGYAAVSALGLPFVISTGATVISVAITIGIGVVFGVYPAGKASKLSPIEALGYE
jgi:putative ABC transport system permease protein